MKKDFLFLKIDTERTIGGQDIMNKYTDGKRTGIPWSAVLNEDGKMIVNSSLSGSNFGFPAADEEIAAFGKFLEKSSKKISRSEIQKLMNSLKKK